MDALFSKTVKASDRTYFIDVRETKKKAKFLTIAESKRAKDGDKKFTRTSIAIFDGCVQEFQDALKEAFGQLEK